MKKLATIVFLAITILNGCGISESKNLAAPDESYIAQANETSPQITFVGNQDYLPALVKLLNRPDIRTIDILHYNFFTENGGAPQVILDNLLRLQAKGVKIRILLEGKKEDPNKRNSITLKS